MAVHDCEDQDEPGLHGIKESKGEHPNQAAADTLVEQGPAFRSFLYGMDRCLDRIHEQSAQSSSLLVVV